MANIARVTVSSVTTSQVIPLNVYADPFNVSFGVKILPAGNSGNTYTVQHTFDNVQSPSFDPATATWYDNNTVVNKIINSDGNYSWPVTAIRLNVTSVGAGLSSLTLTAIQSGY
jgi:hypothetical protein